MILGLIDFGDSLARKINELFPLDKIIILKPDDLAPDKVDGIILSGSPLHIYDPFSPSIPAWVLEANVPILAVCYGMHALVNMMGGEVTRALIAEKGMVDIYVKREDPLLRGVGPKVWMNHEDGILRVPNDFVVIATTQAGIAAITDGKRWAIQFHPEASGQVVFENFRQICQKLI